MRQDFSAVIRARRNALGMNQSRLAELTGVSRNAVAGWETGHSRPDLSTVPFLCEALEISIDAFFGMESPRAAEEDRLLRLFATLEPRDREAILWQTEALAEGRKRQAAMAVPAAKPVRKAREVPVPHFVTVYSSDLGAAAGIGAALDEAQGEEIYLLADAETERADEVITVSGRSMEPTFMDGDRVLVQHTDRLRPGEVGVFLVDNEGYIKEYQPDGLHSHNPDYGMIPLSGEETVRCVGRVIGLLREEQIPTGEQLNRIEEAVRAGERRK
jgi:phage repressor protein C with HTH and peptisase S24 domain/DNA-binding XRE family transcriptional regulator